jgi:hypothetical protein
MKQHDKNCGHNELRLILNDLNKEDGDPVLAIHALDASEKVVESIQAKSKDRFEFSEKSLKKATKFVVMSADVALDKETIKQAYSLSGAQVERILATDKQELVLSPTRWRPILPFIRCVDGNVRKCWWWPFYVEALNKRLVAQAVLPETSLSSIGLSVELARPRLTHLSPIFRPCRPICEGLVEVYERNCCSRQIFIPPVITTITDRLKDFIVRLPETKKPPKFPPPPEPDPIPFEQAGVFIGGTIDTQALDAEADLAYLQSASFEAAKTYIEARPYLLRYACSCGEPVYKGASLIGPDGEFSHCYQSFPFLLYGCHREYAFRVRQVIDGVDTVIYDGLAAGNWFDEGDDITLTSYLPKAVDCDHEDVPVPTDTPFAMLDRIGSTQAWNLQTPEPTGWDRATPTSYNDGLGFPAASVAAARGTYLNRNWGGVLPLRYLFTEPLKAAGAKYYRIRVSAANAIGNPTGTTTYLDDAVVWKYQENLGGYPPQIKIRTRQLNLETNPSYHTIPYMSDESWMSGYFHGALDTRQFGNGRHLVTLELYDSGLNRIVPINSNDIGAGDVTKAFTYEWWHDPLVPSHPEDTENVPYSGLTHMFWWDNRATEAKIVDLRNGGTASSAECQFMSGNAASLFTAGFRAYHPHDWFMHSYRLWWRRGLGGPSGTLENGNLNAGGPGVVPPKESNSNTFDEMLNKLPLPNGRPNEKCTFSLLLHVDTKTFNGSSILNGLDDNDVASFALDVG